MSIAGFTLPELSAYDPPVAGEGSLDPMGLGSISDRLADRLVPGLRARMQRIRFVTAMAVGSLVCEELADELSEDGISTPSICFEWVVLEGFVRRIPASQVPPGLAGGNKARLVVRRGQRLSAATYLKGPQVFGFNGVYKPFAIDAGVVGSQLEPGPRCAALTRVWEQEQGLGGFSDAVPGTEGGRFRSHVRDEVRAALRSGRCTTKSNSPLFGRLAASLHLDEAGPGERSMLRSVLSDHHHETRAEFADHVARVEGDLTESEVLDTVRSRCSGELGRIVDAVVAYEQFAARVDAAFRTLCAISYSMGAQPLTADLARDHPIIVRCTAELPLAYQRAVERMADIGADTGLEDRLGEFAIARGPVELVELALQHHEQIQAARPPNGKRPWFEPLRHGWVVRNQYGSSYEPNPDAGFVHPVRVGALRRFLSDAAP